MVIKRVMACIMACLTLTLTLTMPVSAMSVVAVTSYGVADFEKATSPSSAVDEATFTDVPSFCSIELVQEEAGGPCWREWASLGWEMGGWVLNMASIIAMLDACGVTLGWTCLAIPTLTDNQVGETDQLMAAIVALHECRNNGGSNGPA